MTGRVWVTWRGYRTWWGSRWYGAGSTFGLATAESIAGELRVAGHVAHVVADGIASSGPGERPGQLPLFGPLVNVSRTLCAK